MAYQGYNKRRKNVPDKLITDSSFGTPLAEFMRGFWQPVTLAEQVSRVPKKIKIFGFFESCERKKLRCDER